MNKQTSKKTTSMRNNGIIKLSMLTLVMYSIISNCFILQVHGGSIHQNKVPETKKQVFDCDYRPLTELYPGAGLPICVNGTWICPFEEMCYSYTYNNRGNGFEYFCGPCGGIGSRCNLSQGLTCISPGLCLKDYPWCQCPGKDWERGAICQRLDIEPIPPSFYVLLVIFILIILLNKIIKSVSRGDTLRELWDRRRRNCCCCLHSTGSDSDDETSIVGANERSGEKSASYTMAGNEFMATSDDPDLEWALELSRTMRQPNGEWIEGSASVRSARPRPRNSNRPQPSRRRSARSIQSVESGSRSIQDDGASFRSCEVESIPEDTQSCKCSKHQVQGIECASSASSLHDLENMPSTSFIASGPYDFKNLPSTSLFSSSKSNAPENLASTSYSANVSQNFENIPSTSSSSSVSQNFENIPRTSSTASESDDLDSIPSTPARGSVQLSISSSNVSYRTRKESNERISTT